MVKSHAGLGTNPKLASFATVLIIVIITHSRNKEKTDDAREGGKYLCVWSCRTDASECEKQLRGDKTTVARRRRWS